jgi:hypothetical protein
MAHLQEGLRKSLRAAASDRKGHQQRSHDRPISHHFTVDCIIMIGLFKRRAESRAANFAR